MIVTIHADILLRTHISRSVYLRIWQKLEYQPDIFRSTKGANTVVDLGKLKTASPTVNNTHISRSVLEPRCRKTPEELYR